VGGPVAFTPNETEGGTDDYSGEGAESNEPVEGGAQASNGHAGHGADFPMSEPPRNEVRGGASISWTGMAAPEAEPATATERPNERPAAIEATVAEAEMEPSAIDTAKLPKLEAPAEDTPVAAASQEAVPPPAWPEEPRIAATTPDEPPAAVIVHAAPAEPAAADLPDPTDVAPSAPSNERAPVVPPSRVVWTSGPAPQVTDRGRDD
jgi:hypothetical protein